MDYKICYCCNYEMKICFIHWMATKNCIFTWSQGQKLWSNIGHQSPVTCHSKIIPNTEVYVSDRRTDRQTKSCTPRIFLFRGTPIPFPLTLLLSLVLYLSTVFLYSSYHVSYIQVTSMFLIWKTYY